MWKDYSKEDTEFLNRMMLQGFSYYEAESLLKDMVKKERTPKDES